MMIMMIMIPGAAVRLYGESGGGALPAAWEERLAGAAGASGPRPVAYFRTNVLRAGERVMDREFYVI
jgi:hypothetical protein